MDHHQGIADASGEMDHSYSYFFFYPMLFFLLCVFYEAQREQIAIRK